MYGVPPEGHLQGQTRDKENTRFCQYSREYLPHLYVMSHPVYRDLLFLIIFHTKSNAVVAGYFFCLEIKQTGKRKHAYNKDNKRSIVLKRHIKADVS